MDEDEAGEATTAAETHEVRRWGSDEPLRELPAGREIDVRPDPAGGRTADNTTVLRRPEGPREVATLWPDANTTGAFVSRAASLRHEVQPYRWWEPFFSWWIVIWLVVLGLPVGFGAWALYQILQRV
jgi:hypothetical protein